MKQFFTLPVSGLRFYAALLALVLSAGAMTLQAQTIPTPTQTDQILPPDNGVSGKADPGDKIQYKVNIQNTGAPAATGVQLNAMPDSRTTLDLLSFRSSPLAFPDTYTATGNVGINVPAASGLKSNDYDDNIGAATVIAGTFTTTGGGTIVIMTDGSFTYMPLPGYTGVDTYVYTLEDGNEATGVALISDMATVTITVSNLIWFIDNASVAATSDGRVTSPFKTLADFNAASTPVGDVTYIDNGTGAAYTGGIVLQDNERLFGEGHTGAANLSGVLPFALAPFSNPLPAINGVRPVITNTLGDGVALAMNNSLRGFNVGDCSDFGMDNISTNSIGNLIVSEVNITNTIGGGFEAANGSGASMNAVFGSISSTGGTYGIDLTTCAGTFTASAGTISNPVTAGVLISGGTVTFSTATGIATNAGLAVDIDNHDSNNLSFLGNITSTSTTNIGIQIQNCGGGIIAFFGTKNLNTGANTAVNLVNNGGATIDFATGTLTIVTTTGIGFNATGGGTLLLTSLSNTISKSGNGAALNIANTNAGSFGVTFNSINVTGGTGTAISITSSTGTKNLGIVNVARGGGGTGILATSAGTLTVSDGTINSGNQVAIDIDGAVLGVNLTSVSANGANKGMDIANTTGSFIINGTSTTNGTGGTIQNITTRGAEFFNVTNITLKNMAFTNANTADGGGLGACDATQTLTLSCNGALYLRTVNTLVLNNIDVNGTEEQGLNGIGITNMTMTGCSFINCGDEQYEGSMKIRDLQGTCSITNSTFTFPEDEDVEIFNSSSAATLNLTVTGCMFSDNFDNPIANTGLFIQTASNVTNNINVDDCQFLRLKGRGTDIRASAGTMNVNVTDCTLSKDIKRFMAGAFIIASGTATMNINVNRNIIAMANAPGVAIQGSGSSTFFARVNNNTITGPYSCSVCNTSSMAELDPCTCTGQGISIAAIGTSTGIAEAVSNTISGLDNGAYGIEANSQQDGTLNVLISTNDITISNDSDYGISILASGPTVSPTVCARVINNEITVVGGAVPAPAQFRARASGAGTVVSLQGAGANAAAYWDGNGNMPPSTDPGVLISGSTASGGTLNFGATCTLTLPHPTAMVDPSIPESRYKLLNLEKTGLAMTIGDYPSGFSSLNK